MRFVCRPRARARADLAL